MAQTDEERRAYQRGYQAGQKTAAARVAQMVEDRSRLRDEYRELTDAVEAYCLAVESGAEDRHAYGRMRAALNGVHGGDTITIRLKARAG